LKKTPKETSESTFARTRIERIIGRVFSLAAVATSLETLGNGLGQEAYIDALTLYLSMGLILLAQLTAVFNFWFGSASKKVYIFHGLAYVIAFVKYPFAVIDVNLLPDGFRPWLWWATGTATMAMGMYLTKWWSVGFMGFMPISWFFLRISPIGGSGDVGSALLDSCYIVLFAAAVLALIGMLRAAAYRVDQKNDEAAIAATTRATATATDLERQKLDDLVHDQVLTTLILASKAEDLTARKQAAQSAEAAILRLEQTANEEQLPMQDISVRTFLESLSSIVSRGYPDCEVTLTALEDFPLPINVGMAFSDATIQAVTNSVQHAGKKVKREVHLKADARGLKVVVKDDGRGFRVSAIPKNRFGVRHSIRRRVTSVGGQVNIQSAPRKGATIVMTWGPDA
jgi:signal transduction histidine kinase